MAEIIDTAALDAEKAKRVAMLLNETKDLVEEVIKTLADGQITLGEVASVGKELLEAGAALIAVVGAPKRKRTPKEAFKRLRDLLRHHPTGD